MFFFCRLARQREEKRRRKVKFLITKKAKAFYKIVNNMYDVYIPNRVLLIAYFLLCLQRYCNFKVSTDPIMSIDLKLSKYSYQVLVPYYKTLKRVQNVSDLEIQLFYLLSSVLAKVTLLIMKLTF